MINLQPFAMRPGLMTDNTHGASALLASFGEEAVYPFPESMHPFSEKGACFSRKGACFSRKARWLSEQHPPAKGQLIIFLFSSLINLVISLNENFKYLLILLADADDEILPASGNIHIPGP